MAVGHRLQVKPTPVELYLVKYNLVQSHAQAPMFGLQTVFAMEQVHFPLLTAALAPVCEEHKKQPSA